MLDAVFVAVHDGTWIGMTEFRRDGATEGRWVQDLTGVVRDHRRLGVASALKAQSLLHARDRGVSRIRTWNDADNVGMRLINDRFGFVASHAVLQMMRSLD